MASEARTRWYDPVKLEPVEEVLKADGKGYTRPTVRHARKLGLLPSITSITKLMANWTLEEWKQKNTIKVCAGTPFDGDPADDIAMLGYQKDIMQLSSEVANTAADEGTLIHKEVELALCEGHDPSHPAAVSAARELESWLADHGLHSVSCETSLGSQRLGYAGTPDLFALDAASSPWIIDLKTISNIKNFRKAYESWLMQLGGCYGLLREDKRFSGGSPRLWQCVVDRETTEVKMIDHGDVAHDWFNAFYHLAQLFFWIRQYDPRTGRT